MEDTAVYRAKWIQDNKELTITQILEQYPRLTSNGMVRGNIVHVVIYCFLMFWQCATFNLIANAINFIDRTGLRSLASRCCTQKPAAPIVCREDPAGGSAGAEAGVAVPGINIR